MFLWNSVPHDWDDPLGWVDRAVNDCIHLDHAVVVLHDLPGGATRRLEEFLDRLGELDANFTQDYPPSCIPIERGLVTGAMVGLPFAMA